MIRHLIACAIAWLFAEQRHASDCPYRCPRHQQLWAEWRSRKDRPGFRPSEYER